MVEQLMGEFESAIVSQLPDGLNSPLTKAEKALIKTLLMWLHTKGVLQTPTRTDTEEPEQP